MINIHEKDMPICSVTSNGKDPSYFSEHSHTLRGDPSRMLTNRIDAQNFRLRTSDKDYKSGWHVAGDPTLLIILEGIVRIEIRNGEYRDFTAGEMFIAEDFLNPDIPYNDKLHGHRAMVIGEKDISVLHLKLSNR